MFRSLKLFESRSITPTCIVENALPSFNSIIQEYSADGGSIIVKRFVIDPEATRDQIGQSFIIGRLHDAERPLFEKAFEQIIDFSEAVVLVDIFKRDSSNSPHDEYKITKDEKRNKAEIHTICLWKSQVNKIFIIDPSNSSFSNHLVRSRLLSDLHGELLNNNVKIEIMQHQGGSKNRPDPKFYSSSFGRRIGISNYDARDCIDIAVKIAFTIVREKGCEESNIQKKINLLSNSSAVNRGLGIENEILLRELQSSDSNKRSQTLDKLNSIKELIEYTSFQSEHELDEIVSHSEDQEFMKIFRKHKDLLKESKIGRLRLDKMKKFFSLQTEIDSLYRKASEFNDLPMLKIKLVRSESYSLVLMKNFPDSALAEWRKIYVSIEGDVLKYQVINPNDILVNDEITAGDLKKEIPSNEDLSKLTPLLQNILLVTAKRRHTYLEWIQLEHGCTLLDLAIKNDDTSEALSLIYINLNQKSNSVDLLLIPDDKGRLALHWAALKGNEEVIKMLVGNMRAEDIAKQADGCNGDTALHMALTNQHVQIAELLMVRMKPEDFVRQDRDGSTLLHRIALQGSVKMVEIILSNINPENLIKQDDFGNRVGGASQPRPLTPPYVRCRIRRFQ